MRVASSAVLPHNFEDFVRILFRQAKALLREDRADVVQMRRHEIDDLSALKGDISGISMSSFTIAGTFSAGTRAKSAAWESEYCCSGFNSPRTAFSFSRMTFSSARDTYDSSMVPS